METPAAVGSIPVWFASGNRPWNSTQPAVTARISYEDRALATNPAESLRVSPIWVPDGEKAKNETSSVGVTVSEVAENAPVPRDSTRTVEEAVSTVHQPSLSELKGPAGSPVDRPGTNTWSPATIAENGVPDCAATDTVKFAATVTMTAMLFKVTARAVRKPGAVPPVAKMR